jgi:HEAT repeat protein
MDSETRDRLAQVLTAPGEPLEVREAAAAELAAVGDRRAFETLALLLNYRDEARAGRAAAALARLGDPRTGRAAAALATNALRVGYALPAIRLLVELRAPEAVPALTTTLQRLLAAPPTPHERIALACVEGLGALCAADPPPATRHALRTATTHPRLAPAAHAALARAENYSARV